MFVGQGCKVHLKKDELPMWYVNRFLLQTYDGRKRWSACMILMIALGMERVVFMDIGLKVIRFSGRIRQFCLFFAINYQ